MSSDGAAVEVIVVRAGRRGNGRAGQLDSRRHAAGTCARR